MGQPIVIEGATLLCTAGSAPNVFRATCKDARVGGNWVGSIYDATPGANIPTFGMCIITQSPCMPATAPPWSEPMPGVGVPGQPQQVLAACATLPCPRGGIILVAFPGQTCTLTLNGIPFGPLDLPLMDLPMVEDESSLCGADASGPGACGAQAGACGAAASGVSACGADAGACGAAASGAGACGEAAGACGAQVGGASACGAAAGACGAAANGVSACGADVNACGAAASGASACGAALGACGAQAAGASACGALIPCGADACGADACGVDLTIVDACAADACAVDIIPVVPGI